MKKQVILWDIEGMEEYFRKVNVPDRVTLSCCEVIVDAGKFIGSHIRTVRVHNGNKVYWPYFERLLKLREILS